MWLESVGVALVGGLICLDRNLLQVMISRPIVAGPLTGLLLNDFSAGLVAGALIELLWIDRLPIGSYVPPNDSMTAILITASSILAGAQVGRVSPEIMTLAIVLLLPVGLLGQKIDTLITIKNNQLSHRAIACARKGDARGISRIHLTAIARAFLLNVVLLFVLLIAAVAVLRWLFPLLSDAVLQGLRYMYIFIPVLGIAVAINTIKVRGVVPVFCVLSLILVVITECL